MMSRESAKTLKTICKRACVLILVILCLTLLFVRNSTKTLTVGISVQDTDSRLYQASVSRKSEILVVGVPGRKRFNYPMIHSESVSQVEKNVREASDRPEFEIIFLRTSVEPWEPFELCAFYSAAAKNPTARVKILSITDSLPLPDYFEKYAPTVKLEKINCPKVFQYTKLQSWYKSEKWNITGNPLRTTRHLANAIRHAYLWKYGGTYLDTDMITLRELSGLRNSLAFQNGEKLTSLRAMNGAFLSFERGHPFLALVMGYTRDNFSPNMTEGNYGPKLLTKMVPKYVRLREKNGKEWPELHLLPRQLIYPFTFSRAASLFRPVGSTPRHEAELRNAYTVHLWRNKQRSKYGNPSLEPSPGSVLHRIMQQHCPIVPPKSN